MLSSGQEASHSPKRQMPRGCAYMKCLQQSDSPSWKEKRWSPGTGGGRVGHYRVPLWEDSVCRGTAGEVTRFKVFNTIHLYISRCFKVNLLYFTTTKNFLKIVKGIKVLIHVTARVDLGNTALSENTRGQSPHTGRFCSTVPPLSPNFRYATSLPQKI